ncbi:hypothetical protein, partial [Mesorhizobium sp. 14Argb]
VKWLWLENPAKWATSAIDMPPARRQTIGEVQPSIENVPVWWHPERLGAMSCVSRHRQTE